MIKLYENSKTTVIKIVFVKEASHSSRRVSEKEIL